MLFYYFPFSDEDVQRLSEILDHDESFVNILPFLSSKDDDDLNAAFDNGGAPFLRTNIFDEEHSTSQEIFAKF